MEYTVLLKSFLDTQDRLTAIPVKRKRKLYALSYLAEKFEAGKAYTEKEVNDLLESWHTFHDPATLRRELYDNRFLDRERDRSSYWLEETPPTFPELGNQP